MVLLQWRHNERDGVSNHQPQDCLLNRLFKAKIKENIRAPRHWPVTGEFPAQRASNADNVFIWWRHHGSCPMGPIVWRELCFALYKYRKHDSDCTGWVFFQA